MTHAIGPGLALVALVLILGCSTMFKPSLAYCGLLVVAALLEMCLERHFTGDVSPAGSSKMAVSEGSV